MSTIARPSAGGAPSPGEDAAQRQESGPPGAGNPELLRLSEVTLALGDKSFGPFSLSVCAGERVAILGPSGAGKSTLLKLLSRELAPRGGGIQLDRQPMAHFPLADLSRRRAVLPQSHEVSFGLDTDLVVALGRVARTYDPKLAAIVRQAAELACAGHLLGRRFDTLSGGEKARVQLARVFAQLWDAERGLLLVDEPIAALDPGLQFDLLDAIDTFAAQRGHAVMAVLHDINHALRGFERLLLVKGGRLVEDRASGAGAVDALEALYGVPLDRAIGRNGECIVTPMRGKRTIQTAA